MQKTSLIRGKRESRFSLSVFFPAYNEAENLTSTIESALKVLENLTSKGNIKNWEIIIVNDGSTDGTGEIAEELSRKYKGVRVVHQKNGGYGSALKSGFYKAKYEVIVYNDSDGQFNFAQVDKFLEKLDEADVIIGYRTNRADHFIRKIFAKGWALSLFVFFGLRLKDVDCGFKMVKKSFINKIPKFQSTRGGMINAEIAIKAKEFGFRIVQVGVNHYPRVAGKSTGASIKVIVKSYLDLLNLWWRFVNKKEFLAVLLIITVAAFLRFYRLSEYMTFLGDEGRDVVLVRRLLVNFDPILIGPGTSIGNMYLGPLYYYMMAPAMFFSGLSPVGPAAQIALLGVITVWLVWFVSKEWFGKTAGIVAASLYAVSPVVITYSRSSWNPNIMPFFALLSIYSIWRVWRYRQWKWLLVLGVAYAFALQSHYLGLLLLPVIVLFWLLTMIKAWKIAAQKLPYILNTLYSILVFLFLMSPLVIFDARHGWRNFQAIYKFFSERQETVSIKPWNSIGEIWPIWHEKFIERFMGGMNDVIGMAIALFLLVGIIFLAIKSGKSSLKTPLFLLVVWLSVGLLGLGLYKQNIYDHYFGFMFAAPFILLGAVVQEVIDGKRKVVRVLCVVFTTFIIVINFMQTPLRDPPQRQLQRTEEVARKIADESGGRPFNLAVLAERNYEDAYQ
ncbi:glycosyltransferase, partial [Candidatus Microgenomates bacterium]|nr:glycosyltransferase [Candidatus Microgenomates bacterium]